MACPKLRWASGSGLSDRWARLGGMNPARDVVLPGCWRCSRHRPSGPPRCSFGGDGQVAYWHLARPMGSRVAEPGSQSMRAPIGSTTPPQRSASPGSRDFAEVQVASRSAAGALGRMPCSNPYGHVGHRADRRPAPQGASRRARHRRDLRQPGRGSTRRRRGHYRARARSADRPRHRRRLPPHSAHITRAWQRHRFAAQHLLGG